MPTYDRFEDDTGQTLLITVVGLSLVGTSSATIQIKRPSGEVLSKVATVDTGANTLAYDWTAGDLDEAGTYEFQGVITQPGKVTRTQIGTLTVGGLR